MLLPKLPYRMSGYRSEIVQFRGINYSDAITDGDLADCRNLSARRWPYFTTRNARKTVEKTESVPFAGATAIAAWDKLAVLEGTSLYYGDTVIAEVSAGAKQFAIVGPTLVVWPDKLMINLQEGTVKNMAPTEQEDAAAGGRKFTFTANSIMIPESGMQSTQNKLFTTDSATQNIQVKTYQKAVFKDGAWQKRGETVTAADQVQPGSIMIPYKTAAGAYEMDYSYEDDDNTRHPFKNQDNPDGVYWRVLKAENTGLTGELVTITTGQWISDGEEPEKLSDSYPAGTAIQVSGSQWDRNNREETIKSVDDDTRTLYFQDDTWLYGGQPVTADKDGAIDSTSAQQTVTLTEEAGFSIGAGSVFCREPAEKWTVKFYNHAESTASGKPELAFTPAGDQVYGGDILYKTKEQWWDAGAVTVQVRIPDMDFICESQNRLWGCSNEERTIYASALGEPGQFYQYSGLSTDSYAVAVGTGGAFTGCCKLGTSVLFFKETCIHKILGDLPSEYSLYTYEAEGLKKGCQNSLEVINDTLYYMGLHGVYAYGGGTPQLISSNFGNRTFTDAAGGTDGDSYYLSVKEGTEHHLFVYELLSGIWVREDDTAVTQFARLGKDLYCLTAGGSVFLADSGAEDPDIQWTAEFTPFYETIDGRKRYRKVTLRLDMPAGSWLKAEIQTDRKLWKEVGKALGQNTGTVQLQFPVNRGDRLRLRLTGKGPCTLLYLQRQFSIGSDV